MRPHGPPPGLRSLPAYGEAAAVFAEPMPYPVARAEPAPVPQPGPPPAPGPVPPVLARVVAQVEAWDARTRAAWERHERHSVYRRGVEIGVSVGDAIRLLRTVRTRKIDRWLAEAPRADVEAFEAWRGAFFRKCDALATFATDGLVAADLAMPDDGVVAMAVRNPARMGRIIAGRSGPVATPAATLAVCAATVVLVAREWEFFGSFFARQLRRSGVPFRTRAAARRMRRMNARAGRTLLTRRHTEPLMAAYGALRARGVRGRNADRIVLEALEHADATSGKPWKGLRRLYEVLVYSGDDPTSADWPETFQAALTGAAEYTHVPGREWIIRDYRLGRRLMQLDGKVAPGERWAGIQQGRGSLATGYLRGGQNRTAFADRYSKPFSAFFDSMVVAEGPDHQRQRKAFLPFFSQGAILAHAPFVEATVATLLDQADAVALRSGGHFDLRSDFAYHFPIRVICQLLELPAADVPRVQKWTEASVRSLDTDAGVSFRTALEGQRASDALRAYFDGKLAEARSGTFTGHVISTVARDPTLSEAERVANLGVLVFAGFETTTGLLSRGVETLLRHREQWDHLRDRLVPGPPVEVEGAAVPDREWRWLAWVRTQPERTLQAEDAERRGHLEALVAGSDAAASRFQAIAGQEGMLDQAVEELLRWTAPGTVVPLTTSKAVEVEVEGDLVVKGCPHPAGKPLAIAQGETIAVAIDELNRRCPVGAGHFADADPAHFDATRSENTAHLSFGLRHSCIGAFLARENAKRALEGVLRRFPHLELAGDPIPQEMEMFSGLASLPVRVLAEPAAPSQPAPVHPDPA